MHETLKKAMKPLGISPRQAAVLMIIEGIDNPATPAEISRWLNRERPSVSVLLERMKRKGLIEKAKDTNRKNLIRVTLTKKGKQTIDLLGETKIVASIFSTLSDEQLQNLVSYLNILSDRAYELTQNSK
jgi:DNA-binding MarR family transcriptional regulator